MDAAAFAGGRVWMGRGGEGAGCELDFLSIVGIKSRHVTSGIVCLRHELRRAGRRFWSDFKVRRDHISGGTGRTLDFLDSLDSDSLDPLSTVRP